MKILDRYLARTVIGGTLIALLVLLSVDLFFAFLNEVQEIGQGNYGLREALLYVGLTVPSRIHDLFPMAALLGSLMSLGGLASHSELVSMRAAGVSIQRIIFSVMRAGVMMLVVVFSISEFIAPPAEQMANNYRAMVLSGQVAFQSRYGVWARDGRRFINIEKRLPDGSLGGVKVYQLAADGRLEILLEAGKARHDADGQWRLSDVVEYRIEADRFLRLPDAQERLDALLDPKLLDVVVIKPEKLSARDLYQYLGYLRTNALDTRHYELAFWQRLVAPLSALTMLFIATPFVFGSLRTVGAGQRLLVGVMIGVGFYLADQLMGRLGLVYGFHPLLSALAPPLLFFALGAILLRRTS